MKILITGATGKVGSEIAKALMKENADVVVAGRSKEKIIEILGKGVEFRSFDAYDPDTYSSMLEGIDKMFLLGTEGHDSVEKWKMIVDEAKLKGVKQVVFLSSLGSEYAENRPQRLIELYLQESGIAFTILRPNFFFQNFSVDDIEFIRSGKIFLPCGKGKTSFVDTRDIAAVAVAAFLSSSLNNQMIPITGSEALDYFEVASIFSEVLGRPIVYENPSNDDYAAVQRADGETEQAIKSYLWLYNSVAEGKWEMVADDFKKVTGRNPILLKEFAQEFKHVWQ